jgi:hypothetical protein
MIRMTRVLCNDRNNRSEMPGPKTPEVAVAEFRASAACPGWPVGICLREEIPLVPFEKVPQGL